MEFNISSNQQQMIYDIELNTISTIKFTRREIDIMACVLHNRGEKKIAVLLAISPRTVATHIRNIMLKLGCNSKECIIDFVEKSGKVLYVRQYYLHILIHRSFENQLVKINKIINTRGIICKLNAEGINVEEKQLLIQLTEDLKLSNVFLKDVAEIPENNKQNLYVLVDDKLIQNLTSYTILILSDRENVDFNRERNQYVDFSKGEYYLSVFELLKKIINNDLLDEVIQEFKREHQTIKNSWSGEIAKSSPLLIPFLPASQKLVRSKSIFFITFFSGLVSMLVWVVSNNFITSGERTNQYTITSDLPLPHQTILLKRELLLEKIDKKLQNKDGIRVVVLVGAGGSGKTTIAYQYARSQNKKIDLIWKLNAETKESLIASIKQLAYSIPKTDEEKLELSFILQTKDELEREKRLFEFFKTKVKAYPNWLIIYNNVETFNDIKEYFPHDSKVWGKGTIIITTRDSNIAYNNYIPSENIIIIGELTKEEKLELFNKIVSDFADSANDSKSEKTEFLEQLPPYPFDISLAANYIKVEGISYKKYLQNLLEQKENFISTQKTILNDIGEYNQTRSDIVTLSIKQLINMHPDFKDLLMFVSLINSENIPKDLLMAYKDEIIISRFLHELKKFSLIIEQLPATNTSTATFSIHRTTQQLILTYLITLCNLSSNNESLKNMSITLENYISSDLQTHSGSKKMALLVPHVESFLNHAELINKAISATLEIKIGIFYFHLANYKKAKEYFKQALITYEKNYGKDDIKTASVLVRLGSVYRNMGNYNKAQNLLEKALVVYENNYGKDNIETSRVLAYLGSTYKNIGDYKKAKLFLDQALEGYKNYYGEDHTHTAWILGRLGNFYRSIGDYVKAKELLEQALVVYKKYYGENCIETAWILSHLSSVNINIGNNTQAKNNIEQSLEIYRKYLKTNHVTIAWALVNLGAVNLNLGNYGHAQRFLKEALMIYEESYGKNHIQTAEVLNTLGRVYFFKKNIKTAETLINQALEIFNYNNHPDSHISLQSLAEIYLVRFGEERNNGNKEQSHFWKQESIKYLKAALNIVKVHFPENSSHINRLQLRLDNLKGYKV